MTKLLAAQSMAGGHSEREVVGNCRRYQVGPKDITLNSLRVTSR